LKFLFKQLLKLLNWSLQTFFKETLNERDPNALLITNHNSTNIQQTYFESTIQTVTAKHNINDHQEKEEEATIKRFSKLKLTSSSTNSIIINV
jgi:hypothetical protein